MEDASSSSSGGGGGGGGEGTRHQALKVFVAQNPASIGLNENTPAGRNEVPLPSGDRLDVSFHLKKQWIAAEVKTTISNTADLVRGLFQCVKYKAVMMAIQAVEGEIRDVRAVLVLEVNPPPELIALRNLLGVTVYEGVKPTA